MGNEHSVYQQQSVRPRSSQSVQPRSSQPSQSAQPSEPDGLGEIAYIKYVENLSSVVIKQNIMRNSAAVVFMIKDISFSERSFNGPRWNEERTMQKELQRLATEINNKIIGYEDLRMQCEATHLATINAILIPKVLEIMYNINMDYDFPLELKFYRERRELCEKYLWRISDMSTRLIAKETDEIIQLKAEISRLREQIDQLCVPSAPPAFDDEKM